MAKPSYSEGAFADLERLTGCLTEVSPAEALDIVGLIAEAVALLARHPLLGRAAEHDMSELVISRGGTGRGALYSFEDEQDAVLIPAIRHQREAEYPGFDEY